MDPENDQASESYSPRSQSEESFAQVGEFIRERSREFDRPVLLRPVVPRRRLRNTAEIRFNLLPSELDYDPSTDLNNIYTMQQIITENLTVNRESSQLLRELEADPQSHRQWTNSFDWTPKAYDLLFNTFGHSQFISPQLESINAIMSGKDVICSVQTGGGKSLVFQLPSLLRGDGFMLVIFPIVSLIRDQSDRLQRLGIPYLSTTERNDYREEGENSINSHLIRFLQEGRSTHRIVLTTPEFLDQAVRFRELLVDCHRSGLLDRVVIDEAHCVLEWGQDFRPAYLNLSQLKREFVDIPILCLSATLTPGSLAQTANILGLNHPAIFYSDLNRPNLRYKVVKKSKKMDIELLKTLLSNYPTEQGIIYCSSTSICDSIVNRLTLNNLALDEEASQQQTVALPYYANLPEKEENFRAWMDGRCRIIVATIAFGMGIDKRDVRFVIHFNIAKTIENYFQESGRAGRSGEPADCIVMYHPLDTTIFELLGRERIQQMNDDSRQALRFKLGQMQRYCEDTSICRRQFLIRYFGENMPLECCAGTCDNCLRFGFVKKIDFLPHLTKILDYLQGRNQAWSTQLTKPRLVKMLKGTESVSSLGQEFFGMLSHYHTNEVNNFVDSMISNGFFSILPVAMQDRRPFYKLIFEESRYRQFKAFIEAAPQPSLFYFVLMSDRSLEEESRYINFEERAPERIRREEYRNIMVFAAHPAVEGLMPRPVRPRVREAARARPPRASAAQQRLAIAAPARAQAYPHPVWGFCQTEENFDELRRRLGFFVKRAQPSLFKRSSIIEHIARSLPLSAADYTPLQGEVLSAGLLKEVAHFAETFSLFRQSPNQHQPILPRENRIPSRSFLSSTTAVMPAMQRSVVPSEAVSRDRPDPVFINLIDSGAEEPQVRHNQSFNRIFARELPARESPEAAPLPVLNLQVRQPPADPSLADPREENPADPPLNQEPIDIDELNDEECIRRISEMFSSSPSPNKSEDL